MSDMPRQEVMRLVRESGMSFHLGMPNEAVVEQMTRFANMLRDEMLEAAENAIQCAMEFEREACAKVCDEREQANLYGVRECADAIRARGEK